MAKREQRGKHIVVVGSEKSISADSALRWQEPRRFSESSAAVMAEIRELSSTNSRSEREQTCCAQIGGPDPELTSGRLGGGGFRPRRESRSAAGRRGVSTPVPTPKSALLFGRRGGRVRGGC
jgi:hypothetical protein